MPSASIQGCPVGSTRWTAGACMEEKVEAEVYSRAPEMSGPLSSLRAAAVSFLVLFVCVCFAFNSVAQRRH